jgi:hypothetical protein
MNKSQVRFTRPKRKSTTLIVNELYIILNNKASKKAAQHVTYPFERLR